MVFTSSSRTTIKVVASLCAMIASRNVWYVVTTMQPLDSSSTSILDDRESSGDSEYNSGLQQPEKRTSVFTNKDLVDEDSNKPIANAAEMNIASKEVLSRPLRSQVYDAAEYQRKLQDALTPLPEEKAKTTCYTKHFMAGLRNQYMRFMGVIMTAKKDGFHQIIEESINWKDTFGTDHYLHSSQLWDLVHWNSFHPDLPRFARYEKDVHKDLTAHSTNVTIEGEEYDKINVKYDVPTGHDIWNKTLSTFPPPFGQWPNQGTNRYRQLAKSIELGRAQYVYDLKEDLKIYETVMKGALRPHPFLQAIVDETALKLGGEDGRGYMVIHMRVEPDMAKQKNCWNKKVFYVDNITDMVYKHFPEPPVKTVLIVFARSLLDAMEDHAKTKPERNHHEMVNRHNLDMIQDLLENGMWGGKVKVVEAGSSMVEAAGNPLFKYYSTIAGGIVNFFLAIHSNILVGTEVSTWSTLSVNSRYYRDIKENYFYRPEGLYWATPPNVTKPHRFEC